MQGNRVMVIIAVVAGVVAMAAAFGYLRTASGSLTRETAEPAVDIVIAKADLEADQLLDPAQDLAVQKVPSRTFAFLARAAVKADERAALRGRRINMPIAAGSPILYSHLVGVSDLKIAAGSRAITIDVDRTGVIGGVLVPGDRVDIVVAWKLPETRRGGPGGSETAQPGFAASSSVEAMETRDWGARVVLPNVKVLAVGDRLTRTREQFTFGTLDSRSSRRENLSTVTLEVTLEEGLELIRASGAGTNRLFVFLRPAQGEEAPATGGTLLE